MTAASADGRSSDLNSLQDIWALAKPWSVRPSPQGINNVTRVIDTAAGTYILRTYASDRSLTRIRYELQLLTHLQQKGLSFRVPAPVLTSGGESFALLSGRIVTMSPWLPGSLPKNDNTEQAYTAGQTLAELVTALADLHMEASPEAFPFALSGDFGSWGGISVEAAQAIVKGLALPYDDQIQVSALLENTQAIAPALYQKLPVQVIHRDYDPSNILMEGNKVTAVLDFEFSGPDLRALDLAYALSHWPWGQWNTGKEWEILDAFGRGYMERERLSPAELESLPLIFRLRSTASLFFRLGRYTRGLETRKSLLGRIQETLAFEHWLKTHEDQLLRHLQLW